MQITRKLFLALFFFGVFLVIELLRVTSALDACFQGSAEIVFCATCTLRRLKCHCFLRSVITVEDRDHLFGLRLLK